MTTSHASGPGGVEQYPGQDADRARLHEDRATEGRLLWKGLLALVVTACVGWLRARYLG